MTGHAVTQRFDSVGEYNLYLDRLVCSGKLNGMPSTNDDDNDRKRGGSFNDARRNILIGIPENTAKASALLDAIMADVVQSERPSWDRSVAGFFPCVPAYLAGDPMNMYARVSEQHNAAPLRVFVSVCGSWQISAHDLERRGVAIMALCLALTRVRPVELYAIAEMCKGKKGNRTGASIPVIRLETSPMDLATASYVLTAPAMLRRLMFAYADAEGWDGWWAWGGNPNRAYDRARTMALIGCEDTDLYIPGMMSDRDGIPDPVRWINGHLENYGNVSN
jgi:hypothetical protein